MARRTRWCSIPFVLLVLFFIPLDNYAQNSVSSPDASPGTAGTFHRNASALEFQKEMGSITKAQQEGRLLDAEKLLKAAIADAGAKSLPAPQRRALLMRLARVESELGHYSQAVATAKRVVALDQEANSLQMSRLLFDLNLLAEYSRRAGDSPAGERAVEQAVALARKHPGPGERNLLIALRQLTVFDELAGHQAKARRARAEGARICKAQPTPHSRMCRITLEDFYRANGDTKNAEKIRTEETAPGPRYYHGREDYGREINSLGALAARYKWSGSYNLSEGTYRKAIALAETHVPNPLVAADLYLGLGQLFEREGKNSKAETAYKRSFDMLESVQGRLRIVAIERLSDTPLVRLYQEEGRASEAEALLQSVLSDQEKTLDPFDAALARTLLALVGMKDVAGKYSEAALLCERALNILEADYGTDNPRLIPALNSYAGVLRQLGETDNANAMAARANRLGMRAAALRQRTLPDSPQASRVPAPNPAASTPRRSLSTPANDPHPSQVVTVVPPCAEWTRDNPPVPPHISIWYNPRAAGARLKKSKSITLHLATARGLRYGSTAIPMSRSADGSWQADFTPERASFSSYSIFFFKDAKNRVDNNHWQYWDILKCEHGQPSPWSIAAQARTYTGRLLAPGIQRPPDLPRAIKILKDGLKREPQAYALYLYLWQSELKLGGESPAAYRQVGKQIDAFLKANSNNGYALQQASGFVVVQQEKLPREVVQKFRVVASNVGGRAGDSQIFADFDYWAVDLEKSNLQKKARDYLAFAARYPTSYQAHNAYANAFACEKRLNDLAGAEGVYAKWVAADPAEPYPLLSMAQFYVDRKTRLDLAVKLLDKAAAIYSNDQASGRPHFYKWPGRLESLRGQAYLMLGKLPAARTDLAAATKARPDDSELLFKLGQACEKMGDTSQALKAYLAAASVPYVDSSSPREAYQRLFVAQKLGTVQEADQRISTRIAENTRRAAAAYTPVPYGLPAPKFVFTDLAGKQFDNQMARGKPTLLTFWSPG